MQQVSKARALALVVVAAVTAACSGTPKAAPPPPPVAAAGAIDRTVLPIAEPRTRPITELDARKATPPAALRGEGAGGRAERRDRADRRHRLRPQQRVRRADPACPRSTSWPASGLRYNRFHTTALCSPTRTALLTGRNHHVNNAGAIMELATAFPGNTGIRPNSVTPLAEILRQNGYSTAAFGKYHETPPWEVVGLRALRPLADRLGLRQVLRLHRRRDEPVGARRSTTA